MKHSLAILAFLFSTTSIAEIREGVAYNDTRHVSVTATDFSLAQIHITNVPSKVEVTPDPSCQHRDEGNCPDFEKIIQTEPVVEVWVKYAEYPFQNDQAFNSEIASFYLPTALFSNDQLSEIKNMRGNKNVSLVNKLMALEVSHVQVPVQLPKFGKCDHADSCEIIGYDEVIMPYRKITVSRR